MNCRAQYSIQHEINRVARYEHTSEWKKLIQDKDWREKTRLELRQSGAKWCDYKANECACDAEYKPTGNKLEAMVNDVFGSGK